MKAMAAMADANKKDPDEDRNRKRVKERHTERV